MINLITVKYDDRDESSKGWFASFYDENRSEIFSETAGYPTRANAFRQAINVAKEDARKSGHEIGDVNIHVYASINDSIPSHTEWW